METSKKSKAEIVNNYVRYLKLERNYTANTIAAYQRDLQHLLQFVEEQELSLTAVKLEHLEQFAVGLHEKGKSL